MKLFWYVIYPIFAIPVLTTVAAVTMIFEPKPVYPPKHWAKEEAKRINGR